ncbi:MAG: Nif11-like leader peptide family natural product precursor [Candidatus Omnitrophota bacterium]
MAVLGAKDFIDKMQKDQAFREEVLHAGSGNTASDRLRRAGYYFTRDEFENARQDWVNAHFQQTHEGATRQPLEEHEWINTPYYTHE